MMNKQEKGIQEMIFVYAYFYLVSGGWFYPSAVRMGITNLVIDG